MKKFIEWLEEEHPEVLEERELLRKFGRMLGNTAASAVLATTTLLGGGDVPTPAVQPAGHSAPAPHLPGDAEEEALRGQEEERRRREEESRLQQRNTRGSGRMKKNMKVR